MKSILRVKSLFLKEYALTDGHEISANKSDCIDGFPSTIRKERVKMMEDKLKENSPLKNVRVVAAVICDSIEKKTKIFATARGYGEFKGGWGFPETP